MIILDTNVVSEFGKPQPDMAVTDWINSHDRLGYAVTSITVGEIWTGILSLPAGKRKEGLRETFDQLFRYDFYRRILPFDEVVAPYYATIRAHRKEIGRPISMADAQIAAICRANDCELATRNVKDFEHCGITVVDPWGA